MALTPDDVVHKEFQHVRFKDGLDPDEVDDYLDEIVVEWRKTIEENTRLKARVAELEAGASAVPGLGIPAATPLGAAPAAGSENDAAFTGIIAVAQRVHDQYVAEGQSKARETVAEAEMRAAQILSQAETGHREAMARLSGERDGLERKINELREFENSYRTQLRSYFEGQLRQLDSVQPAAGSAAPLGL